MEVSDLAVTVVVTAVVVVAVAVAVLKEVDGALLDGLVEAPASHEEECDEGDCGGTKDTTDNATDDRASVDMSTRVGRSGVSHGCRCC